MKFVSYFTRSIGARGTLVDVVSDAYIGNFDWNLMPRQSLFFFFPNDVIFTLAVTNRPRQFVTAYCILRGSKKRWKRELHGLEVLSIYRFTKSRTPTISPERRCEISFQLLKLKNQSNVELNFESTKRTKFSLSLSLVYFILTIT